MWVDSTSLIGGRLMDLATREVQRQRNEKQQREQQGRGRRDREPSSVDTLAAVAAADIESEKELRREVKMLSSELESWRRRAETAERSVLGMSQTIAEKSAAQEASARAADVARAAAREAERRLEDVGHHHQRHHHHQQQRPGPGPGRSENNVDGSPLPFDVLSLNDTPGAPCVMCGYQSGKPYKARSTPSAPSAPYRNSHLPIRSLLGAHYSQTFKARGGI